MNWVQHRRWTSAIAAVPTWCTELVSALPGVVRDIGQLRATLTSAAPWMQVTTVVDATLQEAARPARPARPRPRGRLPCRAQIQHRASAQGGILQRFDVDIEGEFRAAWPGLLPVAARVRHPVLNGLRLASVGRVVSTFLAVSGGAVFASVGERGAPQDVAG